MPNILMVASEAAPYVKTGGLADVLGSLPAALARCGEKVSVVIPKFRSVQPVGAERVWDHLPVNVGPNSFSAAIDRHRHNGVDFYFVDIPYLFDRDGIYGHLGSDYPDNHIRFGALSMAAIGIARNIVRPDIIHCHDWQSALVPVYLHSYYQADPRISNVKTIFTIHNLGYQGRFSGDAPRILRELGLGADVFHVDGLEFYGDVNLLKGAINYSHWLTTVSKAYAREIQTVEYGFGLEGLLQKRSAQLSGIVNGVDYSDWNPETDPLIAANYSEANLAGKQACRLDLLREFGLPEKLADRPIVGIVSRFASQKGFDLLAEIAPELLQSDVSLIALGTGEPEYEAIFRELAEAQPWQVRVKVIYDNVLAHKIEAGSDIFLMPSRYEPCGLNQIYSLRYGTPPVVRATGGLDDTIEEATGFKFQDYSGAALLEAIHRALKAWEDQPKWQERMRRGMRKDFSWNVSATEYATLYRQLLRG